MELEWSWNGVEWCGAELDRSRSGADLEWSGVGVKFKWIWSVVELECSRGVLEFSGCSGEDFEWSGV